MDGFASGLTLALVSALFALAAWTSQRATKKGRLLIELRRLGEVRANLPAGPETSRLDGHIEERVRVLNDWLDPVNRRSRRLQSAVSWVAATFATILVFTVPPSIDQEWLRSLTATAIITGFIVLGAIGMLAIESWTVRSARLKNESAERLKSLSRTASALGVGTER